MTKISVTIFFFLSLFPLTAHADPVPLQYSTTWLGNSFGGGEKWVQDFVEGMDVTSDGTVYTASGWDEGGREFGIYQNGEVIGKAADTHGWGTGGGVAVTVSDQYLFLGHSHGNEGGGLKGDQYPLAGFTWFGVSRRHKDGSHAPFSGGRGRFGDMLVLHEVADKTDAQVRGLTVDSQNHLYVSDATAGEIKVYDTETMQLVKSWPLANPRQIAVDGKGTLWIIQAATPNGGADVVRYSRDGAALPQRISFEPNVVPTALCINRKTGALLVADNGPAQQVLIYSGLDRTPKRSGAFGVKGGIYAEPKSGVTGPLRFSGPTGVGTDAQGNIYVGCNQPGGGAILRAFTPQGVLKWQLLGLEFVSTADADPASDETDVFTWKNRYTVDWAKPVGQQWMWRSQTLNPFRFPNDPRLHDSDHNFCAASFRRIGGKPFLVVQGMYQHTLVIYRFEGETAVPAAAFSKGPYGTKDWKIPGEPEKGRWMWRDLNGDGNFQANEFLDADGVDDPESWAWTVDDNGGVWQGQQNGPNPITYYPLQGLDAKGIPIYSRATTQTFALPAPMNHLLRIEYHPATDTMFLTGHTTERPKTGGEWGQVGTEILRFDHWLQGNRVPRYRIALPYDAATGASAPGVSATVATIKAFCTAGDAIFAVESRTAKVHVYDRDTGVELGEMSPGPEVSKESGWVDFPDSIHAIRRKNGEYLVFVEEDWKGKVIVYRWTPAAQ